MNVILASMLFLVAAGSDQAPQACLAEIQLSSAEFYNSVGVRPTLRSLGPSSIFIPRWRSATQGYRIERVTDASLSEPPSRSTSVYVDTRSMLYPSTRFECKSPDLLALSWSQIGVPNGRDNGFAVPAGVYRLSLDFSAFDPASNGQTATTLCRVYSVPFRLLHESSWKTFN